ncbi:hypothetical protein ABKV19_002394 [Rosa sericea]
MKPLSVSRSLCFYSLSPEIQIFFSDGGDRDFSFLRPILSILSRVLSFLSQPQQNPRSERSTERPPRLLLEPSGLAALLLSLFPRPLVISQSHSLSLGALIPSQSPNLCL